MIVIYLRHILRLGMLFTRSVTKLNSMCFDDEKNRKSTRTPWINSRVYSFGATEVSRQETIESLCCQPRSLIGKTALLSHS